MTAPRQANAYGETITVVPEGTSEASGLRQHATNRRQIGALRAILEGMFAQALQRGWYGEMSVKLIIVDGILQVEMEEALHRRHR